MTLNPNGRDWGNLVNWDDLGRFYATFLVIWTIILCCGLTWLVRHRHLPFIKIRNVPLAVLSTCFLHIYLIKIFLAYTTNGHFLCSAEFWIMSVYLPFGIALFQASMVQLRSISDQQQNLIEFERKSPSVPLTPSLGHIRKLWHRWSTLSMATRTYLLIGAGMSTQLIVTAVLYATTPTLQGDWTSFGNVTHAKGQGLCRKSLQWIPSAFWQLAWSWLFGPYILFKIRKIHDIHYWRLQIILSVISGLPGTPLWLAALYIHKFKPVNRWYVPPMWLAPGIIVMQFVTIFFPIYEAHRSRAQMRITLSILDSWDDRTLFSPSDKLSPATSIAKTSSEKSVRLQTPTSSSRRGREIRSMTSLEKALAINPTPLLEFAATKDFTAENIIFLTRVRQWRAAWTFASLGGVEVTDKVRAQLFNMAVDIYVTCVHERTATFPINIESLIRLELDAIFARAVPEGKYVHSTTFDPFGAIQAPVSRLQSAMVSERITVSRELSNDSTSSAETRVEGSTHHYEKLNFEPHPCVMPLGRTTAIVLPGFDQHVFDAAEKSVKYLVLTNTWQKFVDTVGDRLEDIITR